MNHSHPVSDKTLSNWVIGSGLSLNMESPDKDLHTLPFEVTLLNLKNPNKPRP